MEEEYMRLAIKLASHMKGQTTPNPPVGAVVVQDNHIAGIGSHLRYGEDHAEVIALDMAGEKAAGSTVYVTLEPCSHYGQTAPCAHYLIEKRVSRVVIACQDPNKKVSGKGIEKLEQAGITVEVGFLEKEANVLYDIFFHYISTKLPFVTVKTAVSLDGKTATANLESKWITNEAARSDSHQYRHTHDAILVGVNTVLEDNPSLTARIPGGRNPLRIILDTNLRTPVDAKVVTDNKASTWIFVGKEVSKEEMYKFRSPNVRIIKTDANEINVKHVLQKLGEEKISSVFVEGGATVNGSFLKAGLINELIMYIAPIIIGGHSAPGAFGQEGIPQLTDALNLKIKEVTMIEGQLKVIAHKEE